MDYYYGLVLFICCWIPGFGKLPAPINVTMDSFNFKNTLRWTQPADLEGDVIYIVEYKIDIPSNRVAYKRICITHEQQCHSSVITYRSYVRVKARKYSDESDWVTIHFDPYEETIIGAPDVTVSSRSGHLDVSFKGPLVGAELESLKMKYGELIYRVLYWKESDPAHVLNVSTSQSQDTLRDLEAWTVYCVKVRAYVPEYNKSGEFSPAICKETTNNESRKPSAPINVTMESFNFRNTLRWKKPDDLEGDVIYIVEYKMYVTLLFYMEHAPLICMEATNSSIFNIL
ncbi:interleukin-10 receptor subunit beta-like [Hyla sarda]|uniref:interleukin-10 receptor subunit beta-like n=1 Tax=Hyla sarda TaxID=327740 RepID=UPI0024C33786|nr:interleukin-10 receptor subunit beta-like [Hyla sarda]